MRPRERQASVEQGGNGANIVLLVARALACSVEVFLHKNSTFGERYLSAQAAIAALILFVFPVLMPNGAAEDVWLFLAAFLVMCAVTRSTVLARRARGELGPHSFYTGTPRLLGRLREQTVKGAVEPIVVWLTAAVLSEFSPTLAAYLALAGGGLLVSVQLTLAAERKRLIDVHDAFVEQRHTAEQWRSTHRD